MKVPTSNDETRRLAVVNLDWEYIRVSLVAFLLRLWNAAAVVGPHNMFPLSCSIEVSETDAWVSRT